MAIAAFILLTILQLFFAGFILYLCLAFVTGGPFVPSKQTVVAAMIRVAGIRKGMVVYDLGSGDGRVLFAAVRAGAHAVGIEINPYLVWFVRVRAFFSPYRKHIRVMMGDLWKTNLKDADVVCVYLIPWRMDELATKLHKELRPGALVVTNSFMFPRWKPIRTDPNNHVYVYELTGQK